MSRFEDIMRGNKARKSVEFPAPIDAENPDKKLTVDLVVLSGEEEADALAAAREYAKSKGSDEPKGGDPHYDLGLMVHTIARSCVDPDVPGAFCFFFGQGESDRNFNAMADLILSRLDRERIAFLHGIQQVWQSELAPWGRAANEAEIYAKLEKLEGETNPARPFELFRPAEVGSLLLSLVSLLQPFLKDRLLGGLSSAPSLPESGKTPKARKGKLA